MGEVITLKSSAQRETLKAIALNMAAGRVEELLPPDLPRVNQGPPGGAVLGVWEAHAEIGRLKKELTDVTERLGEACRLAIQHKNRAEAKQAAVRTYQTAIRDLATHSHEVRKRNGEMALALVKARRRMEALEKRLNKFRDRVNELAKRNANLRTETGEYRVPVVSLLQCGRGVL